MSGLEIFTATMVAIAIALLGMKVYLTWRFVMELKRVSRYSREKKR